METNKSPKEKFDEIANKYKLNSNEELMIELSDLIGLAYTTSIKDNIQFMKSNYQIIKSDCSHLTNEGKDAFEFEASGHNDDLYECKLCGLIEHR